MASVALNAAFLTAALGLFGNIGLTIWNRYRDRCGIAGALAGEIEAYIELLNPQITSVGFRAIANMERLERLAFLRAYPALPTTHPVFDKVADRIGLLSHKDTRGISRIYNVITGMRLMLTGMSSPGFLEANNNLQKERIFFVARLIEEEEPRARHLIRRLQFIAEEGFWRHCRRTARIGRRTRAAWRWIQDEVLGISRH